MNRTAFPFHHLPHLLHSMNCFAHAPTILELVHSKRRNRVWRLGFLKRRFQSAGRFQSAVAGRFHSVRLLPTERKKLKNRIPAELMAEVAKDLTAGTIGGAALLIVEHPFDTTKVKLQSQPAPLPGQLPKYSGAMDAVKQTIASFIWFNATRLLERLRDKRMAFVGDSLNRNQWISMICLLGASIPDPSKTMETNGSRMFFRVKEFNATIEFYWTPLLVESNSNDPVHHQLQDRIVRVKSIEKHAGQWTDADILVFNSYLWWRRDTVKVLWGSFEDKDGIYKEIEARRAYELVLKTWSEWLEFHIGQQRTQMFFMSMSPTHLWGEEWGIPSEQNCNNKTEPITEEG